MQKRDFHSQGYLINAERGNAGICFQRSPLSSDVKREKAGVGLRGLAISAKVVRGHTMACLPKWRWEVGLLLHGFPTLALIILRTPLRGYLGHDLCLDTSSPAEAGKSVQTLTTSLFRVLPLRNLISRTPCGVANGLETLSINGFPDIGMSQSPGRNKYFNLKETEVWEGREFPLLILHLLFSQLPPVTVSAVLRSQDSLSEEGERMAGGEQIFIYLDT